MYYQIKFKIINWWQDFNRRYDPIKVSLLLVTMMMTLAFLLSMIGRSSGDFDTQQMEQDILIIEKDIESIQESLNGIIYHLKEVQDAQK